jgi:hypothetical protein
MHAEIRTPMVGYDDAIRRAAQTIGVESVTVHAARGYDRWNVNVSDAPTEFSADQVRELLRDNGIDPRTVNVNVSYVEPGGPPADWPWTQLLASLDRIAVALEKQAYTE